MGNWKIENSVRPWKIPRWIEPVLEIFCKQTVLPAFVSLVLFSDFLVQCHSFLRNTNVLAHAHDACPSACCVRNKMSVRLLI